jgi:hypothetical protein
MANDLNYQVFPNEIEPRTVEFTVADWRKKDNFLVNAYVGGGCLVMIILFVALSAFILFSFEALGYSTKEAGGGIALLFALACSIGSVLLVGRRLDKLRISSIENKLSAEVNEQAAIRANAEAKSLTSSVAYIYESSIRLAAELSEHIKEASLWLEDAEREFNENAFSSFWDSIEECARDLADYHEKLGTLSKNAEDYYQKLSIRKHTFPSFPVTNGTIPDASFVMSEFSRVVRLGQTNFEFASIWEHRRTREVLIAGFSSLGEAVGNLAYAIEGSMSEFQESISSNEAKLVEEGIKTRGVVAKAEEKIDKRLLEQNRMLDNIQRDRKPTF